MNFFETGTIRGVLKFFDAEKGFGFVGIGDDKDDIHVGREVGEKNQGKMIAGAVLEVVYSTSDKGKSATSIKFPCYRGRVKFFDFKKGYGFITCDQISGKDVFLHASKLKSPLTAVTSGSDIHFLLIEDEDGRLSAYEAELKHVAIAA